MQNLSYNIFGKTSGLFGFLPNRALLKEGGREAPKGHYVPELPYEEGERKLDAVENVREDLEKKIKKAILAYNDKYTEEDFDKKDEPFEEPLKTDVRDFEAITIQIDRILTTPYEYKDERYTLLDSAPENYDEGRGAKLIEIRNMLTNSDEIQESKKSLPINEHFLDEKWNAYFPDRKSKQIDKDYLPGGETSKEVKIDAYKKIARKMEGAILAYPDKENTVYPKLVQARAYILLQIKLLETESTARAGYEQAEQDLTSTRESVLEMRGSRLAQGSENISMLEERQADWKNKPAYKEIKLAFDGAKGDKEFDKMWRVPEGELSNQNRQEMENLFFTILHEKTNGFESGQFILGPNFLEDHVENRKNFPFVYNEWLKFNGVDPELEMNALHKMNEAENAIDTSTPPIPTVEQIIADGDNRTLAVGSVSISACEENLKNIKVMDKENSEKYSEEAAELSRIKRILEDSAANAKDEHQKARREDWRKQAAHLEKWINLAETKSVYFSRLKGQKQIELEFTRSKLNNRENLQIIMEICMKEFMKAVKIVDSPMGGDDWRKHFHPTVRRLLIASVYNNGVSEFRLDSNGNEKFVENVGKDYYTVLGDMVQSKYFNRIEVGEHLDKEHRVALITTRLAAKMKKNIKTLDQTEKLIQTVIDLKNETDEAKKKEIGKDLIGYPKHLVKLFMNEPDVTKLEAKLAELKGDRALFTKFMEDAGKALQNPYSADAKKFFEDIAKGTYGKKGDVKKILTQEEFDQFNKEMNKIEVDYHMFETDFESRMDVFALLGIRIEGIYDAYQKEVKKDPEMNVDKWDDLFHADKSKFMKLRNLIDTILPASNTKMKEDFLKVFESLHGYSIYKTPNLRKEQAVAIALYGRLKLEIKARESRQGAIDAGEAEALAKINGMTIGDKITEYARGVTDMLFGPGQSWANRGAGLIIVLGALKMAKKAWKGGDKWSTAFRTLFIATAAELAFKHVTGRGLAERLGIETQAEAVSGSFKSVLVQNGREIMKEKDVTEEEHITALYELDKIPFKDLMKWYNGANKESGLPLEGQKDIFPKGIDTGKIVKGITWDVRNRDQHAKKVVMQTMHNFFEYVGRKEGVKKEDAAAMLEERWVKKIADPNYKPDHTEFSIAKGQIDGPNGYRANPNKLTWKIVMESEIDVKDAKDTERTEGLAPIFDYVTETGAGFITWSRSHLFGPLMGHARNFFESLGDKAPAAKEFLGEVGDNLGRKILFTKDEVSFFFEGNEYKIRRFFGEHWELVKEGVKLPFGIIYSVDRLAVPWTLKTLRQLREISKRTKFTTQDHDLALSDLMPADRSIMITSGFTNPKINKTFAYLGYYQLPFMAALSQRGPATPSAEMYYEMPTPADRVGYYISETTLNDVGLEESSRMDPESIFDLMEKRSYEQAAQTFKNKYPELMEKNIREMMYPVHFTKKTTRPEKLYVYWRMPLPGSKEFELKETKRWADYYDPNYLKNRMPFYTDPTKSYMENVVDALTKSIDPTIRVIVGDVAKYVAQVPHLAFGTLEVMGDAINGILGLTGNKAEWIEKLTHRDESTLMAFDEISTAAGDHSLSMSAFYKQEPNARAYKFMLDFAQQKRQSLYLEMFNDMGTKQAPYEGKFYNKLNDRPGGFKYAELAVEYETWKRAGNAPLSKDFEQALSKRVKAEITPPKNP